jgi:hypothetical protein
VAPSLLILCIAGTPHPVPRGRRAAALWCCLRVDGTAQARRVHLVCRRVAEHTAATLIFARPRVLAVRTRTSAPAMQPCSMWMEQVELFSNSAAASACGVLLNKQQAAAKLGIAIKKVDGGSQRLRDGLDEGWGRHARRARPAHPSRSTSLSVARMSDRHASSAAGRTEKRGPLTQG